MFKKILNSPEEAARQIVTTYFKNMVIKGLIPKEQPITLIKSSDLDKYF